MSVNSLAIGRAAVACALAAASIYGGAAWAQDSESQVTQQPVTQPQNAPGDAASAIIGAWEFSNADHDKICRFNFRADAIAGGYRLDIDKNCPNLFPSTKDIVGWAVDNDGGLRLRDADGDAVVERTEVEGGRYD